MEKHARSWRLVALMVVGTACVGCPEDDGGSTSSGGGGAASSSGGASSTSGSSGFSVTVGSSSSSTGSSGSSAGGTSSSAPPVGNGQVGDPCTQDSECTEVADASCYKMFTNPFDGTTVANFPNGFCSRACTDAAECGTGNTCVTMGSAGGMSSATLQYCTPSCSSASDCRASEGYRCQSVFGFGYCAPP